MALDQMSDAEVIGQLFVAEPLILNTHKPQDPFHIINSFDKVEIYGVVITHWLIFLSLRYQLYLECFLGVVKP